MRTDSNIHGPTYRKYIEQVAKPLLSGKTLTPSAARRLTQATAAQVETQRPLYPHDLEMHKTQYTRDPTAKPDLPPPAIEHVRADGSCYELVDEQHAGMAYLEVHGTLTVWVVRRIRYGHA